MNDATTLVVLDDNTKRLDSFVDCLFSGINGPSDIYLGLTVEETIHFLKTVKNIDYLFLDHDLDGQVYVPSGPGTGYEVVCWLVDNPDYMPETVIFHTQNMQGAMEMLKLMPDVVWFSQVWLKEWDFFLEKLEVMNKRRK